MTKLPSSLKITQRAVRMEQKIANLVGRYTELLSQYELARKAYDTARTEAEELYLALRELEKVPFWDEMKDALFTTSERTYDRVFVLGEKVEDLEGELRNIESAFWDANTSLNVGRY